MPARHQHESECWVRYEPCGEHHGHSYSCGGGELGPKCPQYVAPTHKAKILPRHRKLAAAWMDDWDRYHARYEWRNRASLPLKGYAQGAADQEEALTERAEKAENENGRLREALQRVLDEAEAVAPRDNDDSWDPDDVQACCPCCSARSNEATKEPHEGDCAGEAARALLAETPVPTDVPITD